MTKRDNEQLDGPSEAMDSMPYSVSEDETYDLSNLSGAKKAQLLAEGKINPKLFAAKPDGLDPMNFPGKLRKQVEPKDEDVVSGDVTVYAAGDRVKYIKEKIVTEVLEVTAEGVVILNKNGKRLLIKKLTNLEKIDTD